VAINNRGEIVGQAITPAGDTRAVLWTHRPGTQPSIVWDYGPDTGLATPPEGGGSVLVNVSNGQNFADSVSFSKDTPVSGLSFYTSGSRLPMGGTHYHVKFLIDEGGRPGPALAEFDVMAQSIDFIGVFTTTAGNSTDVHRVSLQFPPVLLPKRTTYWVGAAGLLFDAGLYGVVGPGDEQMAFLDGSTLIGDAVHLWRRDVPTSLATTQVPLTARRQLLHT
jgi:hypothetical protein